MIIFKIKYYGLPSETKCKNLYTLYDHIWWHPHPHPHPLESYGYFYNL